MPAGLFTSKLILQPFAQPYEQTAGRVGIALRPGHKDNHDKERHQRQLAQTPQYH